MMKLKVCFVAVVCSFFVLTSGIMAEEAPSKNESLDSGGPSLRMISIVNTHIVEFRIWATNSILINSVKKQNEKMVDMSEIRRIDEEWVDGKANKFAFKLQNNKAGTFLRNKVRSNKILYLEAFLCDNQGAIVGEYPMTSDYWQGDEEKFIESYNSGNGKLYQGPILFDESTNSYSVQVSIPVFDEGTTIGVLIVGLRNIM